MASSPVAQLTQECLAALRLGGPASTASTAHSTREWLEVPADGADSLQIVDGEATRKNHDDDAAQREGETARHILAKLKALLEFLPMRGAPKEVYGTKGTTIVKNGVTVTPEILKQRQEFVRDGYWAVLNHLVDCFDSPWLEKISDLA